MADDIDKIRIIVEPDADGFQQKLDADLKGVEGEIPLTADATEFDSEVKAAKKRAEADPVEIDVDADTKGASVKVKAFKERAEADDIEIPVDVDTKSATAKIKAFLRRQEQEIGKSTKRIGNQLNKSANELQNITQFVVPPVVISSLFALSGAVSALAAGAVAAVGPVVQLGAGLASLPAIGAAAAAGIGSIKFALAGVSDALGGLNEEIDEEKLAALTPEAQKFVRSLDALKGPLIDVQRLVQANLLPSFDNAIQRFEMFGPAAVRAADAVSGAVADIIDNTSALLTNPFYSGIITRQIEQLEPNVTSIGNGLSYLGLALLSVVDAATPFTTYLTKGFETWTLSIARSAATSETMAQFFLDLRGTASTVFTTFRELGSLLLNIFAGATPTGLQLLNMLNDVMERTNAFLDSPKGQTALQDYFQSAMPAIVEIAKLVRDVGMAFIRLAGDPSIPKLIAQIRTELVPALGDLLRTGNENMPALIDAFSSLTRLAEQLLPALEVSANAIGQIAGATATFLQNNPQLAKVITYVLGLSTAFTLVLIPLKVLGGLMGPLIKTLGPLVRLIGTLLKPLLKIGPLLMKLGPLFARLGGLVARFGGFLAKVGPWLLRLVGYAARLWPILQAVGTAIAAVVAAIGIVPVVIAAVVVAIGALIYKSETVRNFLIGVGQAIWDFFKALPGYIMAGITAIGGLLSGLGAMFQNAWNAAVNAVRTAISVYIRLVTSLPTRTIQLLLKLGAMLLGFWRRVWTTAFNAVKAIVTGFLGFVASIPGRIIAGLASLGSLLWTLATNAFNRMRTAIVTVSQNIMSFVRGIPGRITAALGNLGELLYGKGKDVLQGFFDGLKSVWEKIKGWLSGLGNKIKSLKGPIEVDRTLLVDEGKAIMEGFHKGLQERWSGVESFLASRGGFIKGMLSAVGLGNVEDAIGKLFAGEIGIDDVNAVIDKESLGGMHPSTGLADTTRMANLIAKRFGVYITSILRPGAITTTGNRSQHADGMAADFSNGITTPQMDALAAWAYGLIGKAFKQVLYRTMIGGNHFNHVHIGWLSARRHGGRVNAGAGYMTGEVGPEPFFPDQNGYVMSTSKFNKMLALNSRVQNLEMQGRYPDAHPTGSGQVVQENHFDIKLEHNVPNASSLMAILGTRLEAFAQASLAPLAGGMA